MQIPSIGRSGEIDEKKRERNARRMKAIVSKESCLQLSDFERMQILTWTAHGASCLLSF